MHTKLTRSNSGTWKRATRRAQDHAPDVARRDSPGLDRPGLFEARDDRLLFNVDSVLASPDGKDRFDDTVQFYFGERPYPQRRRRGWHTVRG